MPRLEDDRHLDRDPVPAAPLKLYDFTPDVLQPLSRPITEADREAARKLGRPAEIKQ